MGHWRTNKIIKAHRDFDVVVGVDMGASHLHYALADSRGTILQDAAERLRPEDGPRKIIRRLQQGIRALMEGKVGGHRARCPPLASHPRTKLRSVAIGVPSPVDIGRNAVALAANLPGWKKVRLGHELERAFGVPVCVENDANMAALGEHWRGVARGADNFVFIAVGTGIGSGIFIDSKLYRGRAGAAGEISSMNLEWQRWGEDFGSVGYLETHAAGLGIAAEGHKRLGAGRPLRPRNLSEERDAYFVFESYRRGNRLATAILERAFTILGVGIANIVAVVDPDLIVLGGGVARGAPKFMLATLRKVISRIHKTPPPIKLTSLDEKAHLYGAILSALRLT